MQLAHSRLQLPSTPAPATYPLPCPCPLPPAAPVNDAPTATEVAPFNILEDDVAANLPVINLRTLVDDVDLKDSTPDVLTITTSSPSGGSLTRVGDTVTYKPNQDFNGVDSFTYTVTDKAGASDSKTVTINVESVNDLPVVAAGAAALTFTTPRGTPFVISRAQLLTGVSDVETANDALTITMPTLTSGNTITLASSDYTHSATVVSTETFMVTIIDADNGSVQRPVTVTVTGEWGGKTGRQLLAAGLLLAVNPALPPRPALPVHAPAPAPPPGSSHPSSPPPPPLHPYRACPCRRRDNNRPQGPDPEHQRLQQRLL